MAAWRIYLSHVLQLRQARSKPNPNLAESSQIGPSPHKNNPRKRLGFPWMSLSELSLFKELRGPPGPKIILTAFSRFRNAEAQWHMRWRAPAMRSSLAPGRAMWLRPRLFIASGYSDVFQGLQISLS
jgi:hypothetical protein